MSKGEQNPKKSLSNVKEWEAVPSDERKEFWKDHAVTRGQYHHGFAVKGWRPSMEDTMDVKSTLSSIFPNLFGVYDGHGGSECAKFCKTHLLKNLSKREDLLTGTKMALADAFISLDSEYRNKFPMNEDGATATAVVILPVDPQLKELTASTRKGTRKSVKLTKSPSKAFNASFQNSAVFTSEKRQYRIFCACVGDSRAILIKKDGTHVALSNDHNLERPDEYKRIIDGNADIRVDPKHNEKLVYNEDENRGLNVTRTIGDKFFKPIVTAFPEIKDLMIDDTSGFLIIASDGLWAKVSNEEVAQIVKEYGLTQGITNLANLSNKREIYDNCTILGIDLQKLVRTIDEELNSQTENITN